MSLLLRLLVGVTFMPGRSPICIYTWWAGKAEPRAEVDGGRRRGPGNERGKAKVRDEVTNWRLKTGTRENVRGPRVRTSQEPRSLWVLESLMVRLTRARSRRAEQQCPEKEASRVGL